MKTDVRAPTRLDSLMWQDVFNSWSKGEPFIPSPLVFFMQRCLSLLHPSKCIQCEIQRKNISLEVYFPLMSSLPSKG